jgi:hypothetical protein
MKRFAFAKHRRTARGLLPWEWDEPFLKPRLTQSHTTIVVLFDKRVIFVRSHNRSESSCRLSEVAQTHDAISGIQFRVGSRGLVERWTLGPICLSRCSSGCERGLRRFAQFGWFGCRFVDSSYSIRLSSGI